MEVEVDALLPLLSVVMVSIMLISVCHFVSVKQPTKYSSLTSFGSPHSLNTDSDEIVCADVHHSPVATAHACSKVL